ncbi:hypothetical protein [Roseovarius sp. EL26]|uniref:hypothetical protein n=1 Tax=Roseovarius sp. EL26 TaxID=2126672 RepID=UPI000EA03E3D|nr:hypothetical protein [Roseovarius sp. EL26]
MVKVSFIFVVDGQKHEVMATLLVASIRAHHGNNVDIIAYSPANNIDTQSEMFIQMMARYDVKRSLFDNAAPGWATDYPHGNKILACCEPRDTPWSVFLDTDMILSGPCNLDQICQDRTVSGVPEGVPTWGRADEDWVPLYSYFDLPLPSEKIRLTRGRRIAMMPYFNGGLVGFSETAGPDGLRFPEVWLDTAKTVDNSINIENKRPWLDQISLPVAISRAGATLHVLDEFHNFSLYRRKKELPDDIKVMHYHMPAHFRGNDTCQNLLQSVISQTPASEKAAVEHWLKHFTRTQ